MGVTYGNIGTEVISIVPPLPMSPDLGRVAPVGMTSAELHAFNVSAASVDCEIVIVAGPELDDNGEPTHATGIGISINGTRMDVHRLCEHVLTLVTDAGHGLVGRLKILDDMDAYRSVITFEGDTWDWTDEGWE